MIGYGMLDRIRQFAARHEMFPPGSRVGVAFNQNARSPAAYE
jgi:hypothetical protein